MNKRETRLLHQIEKAGVRRSLREHHLLSESELLATKIQVLPPHIRVLLCIFGLGSAIGSYLLFANDHLTWGILLAITAALLFLFAVFGIRRTLSGVLESFDSVASTELLSAAIDGIGSTIGSIFDGV